MGNLEKLGGRIQKYFSLVESHESVVQNLIKEVKKPLHSITNQSVFYRAVLEENSFLNTPFQNIKGYRESLVQIIFTSLQEEFNRLDDIRNKIGSANDSLQKEQLNLESFYRDLKTKGLIDLACLNPCCPSLENIITWSRDVWCYYHSYFLQISQALWYLNYEDESTVKDLADAFGEDIELKKAVNLIRNFQFSKFDFIVEKF